MNLQVLSQSITSALVMLKRHPRRVTGALAALLLGTGVTAFGVAPLAPDVADLPVTEVVEVVQPVAVAQQTDALLAHRFNLYRTEVTRSTDTADSLLSRLGINDAAAAAFLRKDASARSHIFGRSTRTVTAEANDDQQLLKLSMRWPTEDQNFFKRLVIERQGNGFISRIETDRYTRSSRMAAGPIQKSLSQSVERAGLGPVLAQQLTEIFGDAMDLSAAPARQTASAPTMKCWRPMASPCAPVAYSALNWSTADKPCKPCGSAKRAAPGPARAKAGARITASTAAACAKTIWPRWSTVGSPAVLPCA